MDRITHQKKYRDEIALTYEAISWIEKSCKKINDFKDAINAIDPVILKNVQIKYPEIKFIHTQNKINEFEQLKKIINNIDQKQLDDITNEIEKINHLINDNKEMMVNNKISSEWLAKRDGYKQYINIKNEIDKLNELINNKSTSPKISLIDVPVNNNKRQIEHYLENGKKKNFKLFLTISIIVAVALCAAIIAFIFILIYQ